MKISIFIAVIWGVVLGFEYSVDPEGGPLTLQGEVETAFDAWLAALGNPPELFLLEDYPTTFRFANRSLFGPDTASVTLQRSETSRKVEVLLNPKLYQLFGGTILHEVGAALGLPAGLGVMRPLLNAASPSEVMTIDVTAYRTLKNFAKEDLTRDGIVDFYDLAIMASQFGSQGVNLAGDINSDGTVDRVDLRLLTEVYNFTPPSSDPPDPAPTPSLIPTP
jgi:hypothetical protein